MTITAANDINRLYNINSDAVRNSLYSAAADSEGQKMIICSVLFSMQQ